MRSSNMSTNQTIKAFHSLATHAWYAKHYAKLSAQQLKFCSDWLTAHAHLTHNELELAVNRMFLDKPKPPAWKLIMELTSAANSMAKRNQKNEN